VEAGGPRDLSGGEEGLLRLGRAARLAQGVPEREEHLATPSGLDRLLQLARLERQRIQACRLLVRDQSRRLIACACCILDSLLRRGRGHGQREVMSQLGQVRTGIPGIERLEHFGDVPVQARPVRPWDLLVERVAGQRVPESEPADHAGDLLHHSYGDRLVEHPEQLVDTGVLGNQLEGDEAELAPEQGPERQHAPTLAGQMP
jgi:hypothetical protein